MAAAGLWTTPSDLALLALELQRTYAGNSSKILSPATVKQMFTIQKAPVGIGYFLDASGHDLEFSHGGADEGFIAQFTAFAERGQGAFVMTNHDNGGLLIPEIMAAIAEEYGWPSHHPKEKTVVAMDSSALQAYSGEYRVTDFPKVIVTVRPVAGKLVVPGVKDFFPAMDLMPESDSTFFSRETGWPFFFHRDKRGHVTQFTMEGGMAAKKVK